MKIDQAMQICFRNEIKVYPVNENQKIYIEVSQKNKVLKRYQKQLKPNEVNEAMQKTYIYFAKQNK